MSDFLRTHWIQLVNVIQSIRPIDLLDIALLMILVYTILKFVRETRAGQLMKGIGFIVVVFFLSDILELKAIHWISVKALNAGLIAVIVLFQPELRRVLEKFGSTSARLSRLTLGEDEDVIAQWNKAIPIICASVEQLSKTATGALIVIERGTKLGEQILNGTVMQAIPSTELFGNIFYNKTPLHDGAVIMRDGIIWAAACFLPKPQKEELIDKHLGSRHRAAIGMSENSDALVIVVSEETGQISVADDGILTRNYTAKSLERLLRAVLIPQEKDNWRNKTIKLPFLRRKGNKQKDTEQEALPQKEEPTLELPQDDILRALDQPEPQKTAARKPSAKKKKEG
ncbi:MAG: diadenylate cyclase CdaA [Oscillospiraceae bacterium]|nr:diadenylate cyclase CdaA [Oscillospiraceae bacterium]